MALNLGNRKVWIVLLILCCIWIAAVVAPTIYATLYPRSDFQRIVQILESDGASPLSTVALVQNSLKTAGRLRHAVQVSAAIRIETTLESGGRHATKRTQAGYLAWFENRQKTTMLVIEDTETNDSANVYAISEAEPTGLIKGLGPPLVPLAFCLYLVLSKRRRSAA